jgi:coenzyme PQQ biosynthesis protein PqqD
MELTSKPRRKPDFRLELLDDEIVLYHPTDTHMLYFNQTASLIWQLCDGQRSVEEIIALLSAAYPESASDILADVNATLDDFAKQGCIEVIAPPVESA